MDFFIDFFGGFFFLCSHMVTSHQNEHLQNLTLLTHTHFVYVYMLAICRHVCMWRTEPNARCLQSSFSTQGLSQNLDMANLARLACQQVPRILPYHVFPVLGLQICITLFGFFKIGMLKNLSLVLMLAQ